MPELSRFRGIIVKMLYRGYGKHNKPHIHAYYGEYEASVSIDGELLAGSFPSRQFKILSGWLALHEEEIYAAWNRAVAGQDPGMIATLS